MNSLFYILILLYYFQSIAHGLAIILLSRKAFHSECFWLVVVEAAHTRILTSSADDAAAGAERRSTLHSFNRFYGRNNKLWTLEIER